MQRKCGVGLGASKGAASLVGEDLGPLCERSLSHWPSLTPAPVFKLPLGVPFPETPVSRGLLKGILHVP